MPINKLLENIETQSEREQCPRAAYPLSEVIGEQQVAGEVVGEGRVELQNLLQGVPFDDMEITVGQGTHVGTSLGQGHLLPEHIPKHIPLTCKDRESTDLRYYF